MTMKPIISAMHRVNVQSRLEAIRDREAVESRRAPGNDVLDILQHSFPEKNDFTGCAKEGGNDKADKNKEKERERFCSNQFNIEQPPVLQRFSDLSDETSIVV